MRFGALVRAECMRGPADTQLAAADTPGERRRAAHVASRARSDDRTCRATAAHAQTIGEVCLRNLQHLDFVTVDMRFDLCDGTPAF